MYQENKPDDVRVDVELSSLREEQVEGQNEIQVPDQEPISPDSPTAPKVNTPEIISDRVFSLKQQRIGKFMTFIGVVVVLLAGRFSVPSIEVACVEDKAFMVLEPITKFLIASPENEGFRNAIQIIGSGLIDIAFLLTLGYWIFYGKSSRIIVTFAIFYGARAVVQNLIWMPFPEYYWWYDPGFPSLVVPYGRGSDFFFSGHSGFVVICLNEWKKLGFKKLKYFCSALLLLTIFILLVYRIHYTADIFTGVFFADYCYMVVSKHQDKIDRVLISAVAKIRACFKRLRK